MPGCPLLSGSWIRNDLGHRVVNELFPQFSEDVRLCVFKRQLHGRWRWAWTSLGGTPEELAVGSGGTVLSNDAAYAEIPDEHLEEICVCGGSSRGKGPLISPRSRTEYSRASGRSRVSQRSGPRDTCQPVYKEPENIIWCETWRWHWPRARRCTCASRRCLPCPKPRNPRLTTSRYSFALDALIDLLAQGPESRRDLLDCLVEGLEASVRVLRATGSADCPALSRPLRT